MAKLGLLRLAVVGGLLLATSAAAWGQIQGCGLGGAGQSWLCPPIHFGRPPGTEHVQQKKEAAKLRKLKKDGAKLLVLAGQLRTEMARTRRNEMSLAVIRKAREIEKLSRAIQNLMSHD